MTGSERTRPGDDEDPLAGFEIPDDLSGLDDQTPDEMFGSVDEIPDDLSGLDDETPSVALVVTPVADPGPLAATCALAKVDVDAVPSDVGAIAVLRDPAAGEQAAAAISELLRSVPVVLLERREEQVSATHWVGGERTRDLPPGLVLSDAPELLEDLLLHGRRAGDVPGTVTSVGMSRWKALRALAGRRPRG